MLPVCFCRRFRLSLLFRVLCKLSLCDGRFRFYFPKCKLYAHIGAFRSLFTHIWEQYLRCVYKYIGFHDLRRIGSTIKKNHHVYAELVAMHKMKLLHVENIL